MDKYEKKYREMIESLYQNELEYVSYERVTKKDNKHKYHITTRCKLCGVERTAYSSTYKKGTKCRCLKDNKLDSAAKQYARQLYHGLNFDKLGMIYGEDLEKYINASILYDRPTLHRFSNFLEMVKEYIYDLYIKDEVIACRKCHIALPKRNMGKDKRHCKECYEEVRRERGLYVRI